MRADGAAWGVHCCSTNRMTNAARNNSALVLEEETAEQQALVLCEDDVILGYRHPLAEALVASTVVSDEQVCEAEGFADEHIKHFFQALVELEMIDEASLAQVVSRMTCAPWVSLGLLPCPGPTHLVPQWVAEHYNIVPIFVRNAGKESATLYVATDDPTNDQAFEVCSVWSGLRTKPMIALQSEIRQAIAAWYQGDDADDAASMRADANADTRRIPLRSGIYEKKSGTGASNQPGNPSAADALDFDDARCGQKH